MPISPSTRYADISSVIDELMEFSRSLWKTCIEHRQGIPTPKDQKFGIDADSFSQWQNLHVVTDLQKTIYADLSTKGLLTVLTEKGFAEVHWDMLRPIKLIDELVIKLGARPSDCRFFAWRNLRRSYHYMPGPDAAHAFNLLAKVCNERFTTRGVTDWSAETQKDRRRRVAIYDEDFSEPLGAGVLFERHGSNSTNHSGAFLEACRLVGYISPYYERGTVRIQTEFFDAEYLLSMLFGMPTELQGFDSLFGGGGIAFSESLSINDPDISPGRVLLIRGRFGSGKSSLALSLAAEVARKEGFAWVMPLEQTVRECRHYLESITVDTYDPLRIVEGLPKANFAGTSEKAHAKGEILLLQTQKDDLETVFSGIAERAIATRGWLFRVLVLDPINSIFGFEKADSAIERSQIMNRLAEVKATGANLILVAEHDERRNNAVRLVENLADTVIDLTVTERHGYSQRYIEILKSRLQRDQRGKHPFILQSTQGPTVFPSSAAVAAKNKNRRTRQTLVPASFGWGSLEVVLGDSAMFPGDVVVLRGGEGSFKSHVGLFFLLGSDPGSNFRNQRSLYLTPRDSRHSVEAFLNSSTVATYRKREQGLKSIHQVTVVEVPTGFIQPGRIFQILESHFEQAYLNGNIIDRIMIDNVSHWEMSCPFVREDETFADTLMDYLRRQHVTSLFVCSPHAAHEGAVLQSSIVDSANVLIEFHRIEFRAAQRVILRVLKTRAMKHKRESFDLLLVDNELQLGTNSKLLRVGTSGEIKPVPTTLYLHQENELQRVYNALIVDSLKPVLSQNVLCNAKDRTHLVKAIQLSTYSTVDELQLLQLDEFQLPPVPNTSSKGFLHMFSNEDWDNNRWSDIAYDLQVRIGRGSIASDLSAHDFVNLAAFCSKLVRQSDELSKRLWVHFSHPTRERLLGGAGAVRDASLMGSLLDDLNGAIRKESFCTTTIVKGLRPDAARRIQLHRQQRPSDVLELNRLLLTEWYPGEIASRVEGAFIAIPYFNNLGLLAFRKGLALHPDEADDWEKLANRCAEWEQYHTEPGEIFFWFETNIEETYNCLFFEILLSMGSTPPTGTRHGRDSTACGLSGWLGDARLPKACALLRTLCRKVHFASRGSYSSSVIKVADVPEWSNSITMGSDSHTSTGAVTGGKKPVSVTAAQVWRHWFTSLCQMMNELPPDARRDIEVRCLPGRIAVAGEWYLGVPAYSAAPDVALELMKILTTREEELERLRRGVGLPTRTTYYDSDRALLQSEHVSLQGDEIGRLLQNAFRRSTFDCYQKVSRLLSFHLQRIIEIDPSPGTFRGDPDETVDLQIRMRIADLRRNISFVLNQTACAGCKNPARAKDC